MRGWALTPTPAGPLSRRRGGICCFATGCSATRVLQKHFKGFAAPWVAKQPKPLPPGEASAQRAAVRATEAVKFLGQNLRFFSGLATGPHPNPFGAPSPDGEGMGVASQRGAAEHGFCRIISIASMLHGLRSNPKLSLREASAQRGGGEGCQMICLRDVPTVRQMTVK